MAKNQYQNYLASKGINVFNPKKIFIEPNSGEITVVSNRGNEQSFLIPERYTIPDDIQTQSEYRASLLQVA